MKIILDNHRQHSDLKTLEDHKITQFNNGAHYRKSRLLLLISLTLCHTSRGDYNGPEVAWEADSNVDSKVTRCSLLIAQLLNKIIIWGSKYK